MVSRTLPPGVALADGSIHPGQSSSRIWRGKHCKAHDILPEASTSAALVAGHHQCSRTGSTPCSLLGRSPSLRPEESRSTPPKMAEESSRHPLNPPTCATSILPHPTIRRTQRARRTRTSGSKSLAPSDVTCTCHDKSASGGKKREQERGGGTRGRDERAKSCATERAIGRFTLCA